jgi:hypothetical protein
MTRRQRTFSRVKAALLTRGMKFDIMVITALVVLLVAALVLAPGRAEAQLTFPRLGMSASPDFFDPEITVENGETFTLHVSAVGFEPGLPMDQDVSVLQWAVHQVCCGAVLNILEVQYNPALSHSGEPYFGVSSSSETCISQDSILLATLTVSMDAPEPGEYLAAAGPFAPAFDCEGNNPLFMDMPMTITVNGEPTPTLGSTWDSLKAIYR